MREIFLPTLKKIRIKDFTLYPNGLDFEYDFINGVNVIMGGNGMGKTTFVNIIKYSIIGHYKKYFDYTRKYRDSKIEKRKMYPPDYFKNRQDSSINKEENATVIVDFEINENIFSVERCMETITLNSYTFNGTEIKGDIISQYKYEALKTGDKSTYLQKKYEEHIESVSGLSFDDLIFFVNEILFFGEDHNTILWNDGENNTDVQHELFSKYFNPREIDEARKKAIGNARYNESQSKAKSEERKAIKDVIDKVLVNKNENTSTNVTTLNSQIIELKDKIEKLDENIAKKQIERKKIESKTLLIRNQINEISLYEDNLEKNKKAAENRLFANKYIHLHKNYDLYFQSIKTNHLCPLCSKEVDDNFSNEKLEHSNNCILCDQEISETDNKELDEEYKAINKKLIEEHTKIQNYQKELNESERKLNLLDKEFNQLSTEKRRIQSELRNLEFANSKTSKKDVDQLQAFYDQMEKLEKEKNKFQKVARQEREKAKNLSDKMREQISKQTNRFSSLFSDFAEEFLGVECSLTFDDFGIGKRLYPVIDGKIRQNEEELSESQRFFIDHSFRMSILSFFYSKPTFYIVETPDSSLDISYEKNAANVFMKFLENDNALIITTNLNNSEFLNHLIYLAKNRISVINLLDIAKKSIIQRSSESLKDIYNKIILKIK